MPLHVGLLGSAATHGRWAERLAAGHALGKKCEMREQHPVASHSPIHRARHALPATVLSAGTPPNLVAESSLDCLGARLQPLRPGGLVRQPDSRTGAPAGSVVSRIGNYGSRRHGAQEMLGARSGTEEQKQPGTLQIRELGQLSQRALAQDWMNSWWPMGTPNATNPRSAGGLSPPRQTSSPSSRMPGGAGPPRA